MMAKDSTEHCNAYDLSSGPGARAIREAELRRKFRERVIPPKINPYDSFDQPRSAYDLGATGDIRRTHKVLEDAYVNERLELLDNI